jgi:hypothetical protein
MAQGLAGVDKPDPMLIVSRHAIGVGKNLF